MRHLFSDNVFVRGERPRGLLRFVVRVDAAAVAGGARLRRKVVGVANTCASVSIVEPRSGGGEIEPSGHRSHWRLAHKRGRGRAGFGNQAHVHTHAFVRDSASVLVRTLTP